MYVSENKFTTSTVDSVVSGGSNRWNNACSSKGEQQRCYIVAGPLNGTSDEFLNMLAQVFTRGDISDGIKFAVQKLKTKQLKIQI